MVDIRHACILIVDDDEDILFSLKLLLKQHFSQVFTETNPYHLFRAIQQYQPDVLMLDMNFRSHQTKGEEGMTWLGKVKAEFPDLPVVLMTAYSDVQTAIKAIKVGATDFIEKPWRNEKLIATLHAVTQLGQSKQALDKTTKQNAILTQDINQAFGDILGHSQIILDLKKMIEKVAPTDANVLILGENGTGKELIARSIHRLSVRREQIFMGVDLGAISQTLFESELFGHLKGAFTGADKDKTGRFVAASGGTLFLDEIGNLPINLQPKLLQALQNQEVFSVGSTSPTPVDIRIISATNMPLNKMVQENSFRQDLLYRINTVEIAVPPLRHRGEDISLLAQHFLDLYAKKYNKENLKFHQDTLAALEGYSWPGNIRELRHSVERAIILSEQNRLMPQDFNLQTANVQEEVNTDSLNLEQMEARYVRKALVKYHGNVSKAAEALGITRPALYRRMDKFGL